MEFQRFIKTVTTAAILFLSFLFSNTDNEDLNINFPSVSAKELIKFIAKMTDANFIYNQDTLDFNVSFIIADAKNKKDLLEAFIKSLQQRGFIINHQNNYYIIKRIEEDDDKSIATIEYDVSPSIEETAFKVYKLQYHSGAEILEALKNISDNGKEYLTNAVSSMQWIPSTNTLFFSGTEKALSKLSSLIEKLDTPLRQVFIEVLVIETSMNNSLDFGLRWSSTNQLSPNLKLQTNHQDPSHNDALIPQNNRGFDLGIIGDIISHKNKSFSTLSSLISWLQLEQTSSIVLTQKIITQENKTSKIFVGDNIPFTGSIVQDQNKNSFSTASLEYKDIGVSLNLMPMIGENNIITLDISEEITEARENAFNEKGYIQGIQTTKTNMTTSVHVPDDHFLILSGMTRNAKQTQKSKAPCLGGLPFIANLFNDTKKKQEKSNILIFVKPHIINSYAEYQLISKKHHISGPSS